MKYTHLLWIILSIALSCQSLSAQEQVYRDTTKVSSTWAGTGSQIHISSYIQSPFNRDRSRIQTKYSFPNYEAKLYFPQDFQGGFDSLYSKTVEHPEYHLSVVWTYLDRLGSAKVEYFYPSGALQRVFNFKGRELDEIIRIDSMQENKLENDYFNWEKLAKEKWKRDTAYQYQPILHGIVKAWHPNGQLAKVDTFNMGIPNDTIRSFHPNGKIALLSVCRSGTLRPSFRILHTFSEKIQSMTQKQEPMDCLRQTWYSNGNKESEEQFLSGKIEQKSYWYENGHPKSNTYLLVDDTIGVVEKYYPNGNLKLRGTYDTIPSMETKEEFVEYMDMISNKLGIPVIKEDQDGYLEFLIPINKRTFKQGKFEAWNEAGKKIYTKSYELGMLAKQKIEATDEELQHFDYPPDAINCYKKVNFILPKESRRYNREICIGNITESRTDTSEIEITFPNSDSTALFTEIVHFENPTGKNTYSCYYPDGQIQMRLHFAGSEQMEKDIKELYNKRKRQRSPLYEMGISTFWYPNGNKQWEKVYQELAFSSNPFLTEEKTYYENGNLKEEKFFGENPNENSYHSMVKTGPQRKYYKNNQMMSESTYTDGYKDGKEKHWNIDGDLTKQLSYQRDKLHGWQYHYDEGKLIRKEYYILGEKKNNY